MSEKFHTSLWRHLSRDLWFFKSFCDKSYSWMIEETCHRSRNLGPQDNSQKNELWRRVCEIAEMWSKMTSQGKWFFFCFFHFALITPTFFEIERQTTTHLKSLEKRFRMIHQNRSYLQYHMRCHMISDITDFFQILQLVTSRIIKTLGCWLIHLKELIKLFHMSGQSPLSSKNVEVMDWN